jgi:hypothetical protein
MKAMLTNANPHAVALRLKLGSPLQGRVNGIKATRVKDGESVTELTLPANGKRELVWQVSRPNGS